MSDDQALVAVAPPAHELVAMVTPPVSPLLLESLVIAKESSPVEDVTLERYSLVNPESLEVRLVAL